MSTFEHDPRTTSIVTVDETGTIHVRGELDVGTANELHVVLEATDPSRSILLDLSETTFIDSCGLRTLLVASERRSRSGATVTLVAPSPQTIRLLRVTELSYRFRIEHSRGAVLTGAR